MTGAKTEMREALLAAGRARVQAHGYNALSFRDLAKEVGIKSASVHYYFPTKADLAADLARRYTQDGSALLTEILSASNDPRECIDQYTRIFRAARADENRMCLCGIMGAEMDALPQKVRAEIDGFATMNINWLVNVLALAKPKANAGDLKEHATAIFAAVEGAQLVARGCGEIEVYDRSIRAYRTSGLMP